jgi:transposase-like protein
MQKIPKQEYTAEFREQVIKRVQEGKSMRGVAKEIGLAGQTIRNWVKGFKAGTLNGAGAVPVRPEAMELSRPLSAMESETKADRCG